MATELAVEVMSSNPGSAIGLFCSLEQITSVFLRSACSGGDFICKSCKVH